MNVLIVEDQECMRRALCDYVKSAYPHFQVHEAENGAQALAISREIGPGIVLMDVQLPDANGLHVTLQVKELSPSTEVIIISQHDAQPYIDQSRAVGAAAYINKNRVFEELRPAIERALCLLGANCGSGAAK